MKRSRATLAASLAGAAVIAGCGFGGSAEVEDGGSWRRLPDPPLSPRQHALGVWTGREALVLGGSDAPPVPPGAEVADPVHKPALRDGAAFDPRTRRWRRVAPAPIGLEPFPVSAVVGRTVYVAVARTPGSRDTRMDLLAYRTRRDRWSRLPSPPRRNYVLVEAFGRLVAAGPSRGPVPFSVFVLRAGRRWERLPDAPFRGSLTPFRGRLVLIGSDPASRSGNRPPLARAATLRPGADAWRRLPDSDHVLSGGLWVRVGDRLVSPELGSGSPDYSFDRPGGGVLDPERGEWSELPNVPEPTEERGTEFGTGVLKRTALVGGAPGTLVLDTTRDDWVRIPRLRGGRDERLGWTVAGAGRALLLFGGARFTERRPEGRLLKDAWLWMPPPAG